MKRRMWVIFCLLIAAFAITFSADAAPRLNKRAITLVQGTRFTLKVKGTKKTATWKSSKPSIATVSKKGVVKAKGKGSANIVAFVGKKTKLKCKVKVIEGALAEKKATIRVGENIKLKYKGKGNVRKWKTSDKSIATVSKKGLVRGKATGKATITAVVGDSKLTCRITVKKANKKQKETPEESGEQETKKQEESSKQETKETRKQEESSVQPTSPEETSAEVKPTKPAETQPTKPTESSTEESSEEESSEKDIEKYAVTVDKSVGFLNYSVTTYPKEVTGSQYDYDIELWNEPKYHLYCYTYKWQDEMVTDPAMAIVFLKTNNEDRNSIRIEGDDLGTSSHSYGNVKYKSPNQTVRSQRNEVEGGYYTNFTASTPGKKYIYFTENIDGEPVKVASITFQVQDGTNALNQWLDEKISEVTNEGMTTVEKVNALNNWVKYGGEVHYLYTKSYDIDAWTFDYWHLTSEIGPLWEVRSVSCSGATNILGMLMNRIGVTWRQYMTSGGHIECETLIDNTWGRSDPQPPVDTGLLDASKVVFKN